MMFRMGGFSQSSALIVGLTALLALSGCGGSDGPAGAQTGPSSASGQSTGKASLSRRQAEPTKDAGVTRDCDSRVEGGPVATKYDVVVGPVTFVNLRRAAREPPSFFRRRRDGYASWKTLIKVQANSTATVVADDERRLGLAYDGSAGFVNDLHDLPHRVTFEACKRSEPKRVGKGTVGAMTQFNGAFVSAGPGCRSFSVLTGRKADPIRSRIGFGTGRSRC